MLRIPFIFFLISTYSLNAIGIAESIQKIQNRTLIVIIEFPLAKIEKRLDTNERSEYETAITNYNRKLKEIIGNFWTLNNKVEYKTWDEVNSLIKDKADGYLLFYAGNYRIDPAITESMMQKGLNFSSIIFTESYKRNYNEYFTAYKLCFLEDLKKNKSIVTRTITNLWPLKEDIIFACQYIQHILLEAKQLNLLMDDAQLSMLHHEDLKDAELLINADLIKDDLTNSDIEKVYPYHFKIVSHDTLLDKISNKEGIIYIEIVPKMTSTGEAIRLGYEHILMRADSGIIVSYVPVNKSALHATAGNGVHHKYISRGIFEKYLQIPKSVLTTEPEE